MKYRVLITQDEDRMFVAEAPALPGCISQGNTKADTLWNREVAIQAKRSLLCEQPVHRFWAAGSAKLSELRREGSQGAQENWRNYVSRCSDS